MYVDGGILCNYPVHVFDGKIQKKMITREFMFGSVLTIYVVSGLTIT